MELQFIIASLLSERLDEKYIYFGQVQKMYIESDEMEWILDGENGGLHRQVEIQVFHKILHIIIGK